MNEYANKQSGNETIEHVRRALEASRTAKLQASEYLHADLQAKLERPEGLCTSICKDGKENLRRMRFILDAWERGVMLEAAPRATINQWLAVRYDSPPFDFGSTVYRVAQ
jgi:hypothetical protein